MRPHPKQRIEDLYPTGELARPFESENAMAEDEQRVVDQQRRSSGNLSDDPVDMPVGSDRPFKNLTSGR